MSFLKKIIDWFKSEKKIETKTSAAAQEPKPSEKTKAKTPRTRKARDASVVKERKPRKKRTPAAPKED